MTMLVHRCLDDGEKERENEIVCVRERERERERFTTGVLEADRTCSNNYMGQYYSPRFSMSTAGMKLNIKRFGQTQ